MIVINGVSISPNPVDALSTFLIAVDAEDIITYYRWSDLASLTWAQIKAKTWNEISAYRNPENSIQSVIRSGDFISGQDHNITQ